MNGATDEIAAVSRPAQPAALLSGAFNFRDLGGLPTTDGSRTVFGSVFRSDALDDLTPRDFEILGGVLGIKTVVDLRAAVETEGRQPPWKRGLDAELVRLPLSDEWTSWGELDAESRRTLLARKYLSYLDSAGGNIISALNVITGNAGRRPTIVHCTVGKDRTGVLVSILLSLLGVERDAIVADYLLTAANMNPIMERLRASHIFRDRVLANPAEVYLAQEHTMRIFLQTLDERDGGPVAWALSNGFAPDQMQLLKSALTSH
jgi:protein-tyrosine phosphatase